MEIHELYRLVEDFYGYKCRIVSCDSEEKRIYCILYDSFWLRCGLGEHYGEFAANIGIGEMNGVNDYFGKGISINRDVESIKRSLRAFDDYCRMSLPDKFLEAYDKAYLVR